MSRGSGARARGRGIFAAVAAAMVAGGGCGDGASPDGAAAFPLPAPTAERAVSPDDFVGAEACAECHAEQHRAWEGSTHGRAGGPPAPRVLIAPFAGTPIRFADAVVVPRERAGVYEFVVRQEHFEEAVYAVVGVIGGGHMRGGGTQGFLTALPDGTERFLPWDWSRDEGAWFCNTGSRTNQGWVPITPAMVLADCGDWPPSRAIGTVSRFTNCQECHGSQILTRLDPALASYRTDYATLQINCESCHGPARTHVELARSGFRDGGPDIGLASLAWTDKNASLAVCLACHGLKDVLEEGYLPGEELEAYYALKFPVLGDQPYFADGRVRTFAYQANHLASACYLQGPMDCVSCHEPHGQGYWDVNREPLASPFDDGQCTACHASKAENPEAHSGHPAGRDGVRCVQCHMPYLQHPEVGPRVPFARSDHTIAVPRPAFDDNLGILGACRSCHQDRSPLRLQSDATALWGEAKPHRPLIEGQVGELRARNLGEAADLLLRPEEHDPLLQFQSLARLLTVYVPPDSPLPTEAAARLDALADDEDLDVRALALATLHWARGDDPATRPALVDALASDPRREALRARWQLALGFLGDHYRQGDDALRAEVAYRKALELNPGDPRVLANLGLLLNQVGNATAAVSAFRESVTGDPSRPLVWVNLGVALAASGDVVGARDAYERALELDPSEALAHFNLGNLRQRAGDFEGAVAAYRNAVSSDPGTGRAHFELARTLIRLERFEEALPHARRAVEFRRFHAPSAQMLEDLESALNR